MPRPKLIKKLKYDYPVDVYGVSEICPNCGRYFQKAWKFCPICGLVIERDYVIKGDKVYKKKVEEK